MAHNNLSEAEIGEKRIFNKISVENKVLVGSPMGENSLGTNLFKKYIGAIKNDPVIRQEFVDNDEDMDETAPGGCHDLRRTAVTLLSQGGHNMSEITSLSRHRSLDMLKLYDSNNKESRIRLGNTDFI